MPVIINLYRRMGDLFKHRPAAVLLTFIGLLLAATIIIGVQTYQHDQEIKSLQTSFCIENPDRCSELLDRLLDDPTPEQRAKIRRIVEGK